ncbi:GPW/gp25 family protein [Aquimarina agarivorans]|uniref:GPW/gp25 family protein n=1 Tax=Aquimarina agarivorans TaxID=980584 RepID=UPI000248E929|nr:GPW/gp25 family protein [Aquimarina agarivorans]
MRYYKLPLTVDKILLNEEANTCSLEESISKFIHLIATSHFGELDYDASFGCKIWNVDFDNLSGTDKLKNSISKSISKSLILHEKRLEKIMVDVSVIQDEFKGKTKHNRVKKRVDIKVSGTKKQTNESFSCVESFYIAPLAY